MPKKKKADDRWKIIVAVGTMLGALLAGLGTLLSGVGDVLTGLADLLR